MLTTEEVSRFISPPPSTVEGFESFIAWTLRQRAAGAYMCFAVTVKGFDTAIGIFQIRETEPRFGLTDLEDADGRVEPFHRHREAHIGAGRPLPERPGNEAFEAF